MTGWPGADAATISRYSRCGITRLQLDLAGDQIPIALENRHRRAFAIGRKGEPVGDLRIEPLFTAPGKIELIMVCLG
jgi:hypothetical protein